MSYSRQLVDQIKANFTRKSKAQLQAILRDKLSGEWSPEAIVAAEELIQDRESGRAVEPASAEVEAAPPRARDAAAAGLLAGLSLLTLPLGFMVLPFNEDPEEVRDTIATDIPIPFGSDTAWLALKTTDARAVAAALGLGRKKDSAWQRPQSQATVEETTWEAGLHAARHGAVFVTPSVGEWTLAVSDSLVPNIPPGAFIQPLLERLSTVFEEAQFFCIRGSEGINAWARAKSGRLLRGFCEWNGGSWSEGAVTKQEATIGLTFTADTNGSSITEENVLDMASFWSFDPSTLDESFKEPVLGLLGDGPWHGSQ